MTPDGSLVLYKNVFLAIALMKFMYYLYLQNCYGKRIINIFYSDSLRILEKIFPITTGTFSITLISLA